MRTVPYILGIAALLVTVSLASAATFQFNSGGSLAFQVHASTITGYTSHSLSDTELRLIRDVGGSIVRTDFAWSSIQSTSSASYVWGSMDAKVARAQAQGLTVLGIIGYAPQWASYSGCTVGANQACAPADPNQYAAFAAAVVAHYPQITYWELWNEPNLKGFWGPAPTSTDYVRILNAAYIAIKAVNPNAVIISAGLAPASDVVGQKIAPTTFVTSMYANGATFDILGYHPYSYPSSPDNANGNGWQMMYTIRNTMVANGDSAKKIWITEVGAPTCGPGSAFSFNQTAGFTSSDYMTQQALIAFATSTINDVNSLSYIGAFIWYEIADSNSNDNSTRENCFGVFYSDFSPKPAAAYIRPN